MGMYVALRELLPGDRARLNAPEHDLFSRSEPATLSLEKAWDGLHRLLTAVGDSPELGFLVSGDGEPLGPDLGYGPARVLSTDYLRRLDLELRGIPDDELWAGFDAGVFEAEGVYPSIWDEDEDELRDEYVGYFRELKSFVARVAAAGGEVAVALF